MKKILLILLLVLVTGCTKEEKSIIPNEIEDKVDEKQEEIYVDNNPIKLGLFLYDNNYHNKSRIEDIYYTNFISGSDIGSFEVFLTDNKIIEGNKFKDTWKKYYDMYNNIDEYKIGFNINFALKDGTSYSSNFLEPDIFRFGEYFFVYLYDDINQPDGAFYSHLEEMEDNTMITSVKLYAVGGIDKVDEIKLSAFTYKSDNDFKNDSYRGNSIYSIKIKRN